MAGQRRATWFAVVLAAVGGSLTGTGCQGPDTPPMTAGPSAQAGGVSTSGAARPSEGAVMQARSAAPGDYQSTPYEMTTGD